MENEKLNELKQKGLVKDYHYVNVSEDLVEDEESAFRNTERLVLTFNDNTKFVIDTFCSGSFENTTLFFELE